MISIKENIHSEFIISKSKFITELIRVNSEEDVQNNLNGIKKKYVGATHYCYAYIIGNVKRFNDDGEPNGTAGIPILNVLEHNNLNNILCIVIRYYGGIKLGAGGLVRAYSTATSNALDKSEFVKLVEGVKVGIEFNYDETSSIEYLLKNAIINSKDFSEVVSIIFSITNYEYEKIKNELKLSTISLNKLENIIIEE